jgi:hypothetical protein
MLSSRTTIRRAARSPPGSTYRLPINEYDKPVHPVGRSRLHDVGSRSNRPPRPRDLARTGRSQKPGPRHLARSRGRGSRHRTKNLSPSAFSGFGLTRAGRSRRGTTPSPMLAKFAIDYVPLPRRHSPRLTHHTDDPVELEEFLMRLLAARAHILEVRHDGRALVGPQFASPPACCANPWAWTPPRCATVSTSPPEAAVRSAAAHPSRRLRRGEDDALFVFFAGPRRPRRIAPSPLIDLYAPAIRGKFRAHA